MTTAPTIVVGIDGGPASIAALEAAIHEAALRGTTVTAMTCWPAADRRDDSGPLPCDSHEQATEVMEHVVNEATRRGSDPDVTIIRRISQSHAGPSLVDASREADLVVLGSTTRGVRGRHHGKQTIEHCLRYAATPVLIVPWTEATIDEVDIDSDLHLTSTKR